MEETSLSSQALGVSRMPMRDIGVQLRVSNDTEVVLILGITANGTERIKSS